ncbi:hypothetical protein [Aeromonas hydrophila]|uniref:hypothetical protein n=1 Tax=Aeromonas hydrophila TaxID=644 RepID=UPI001EE3ACE5|nr:hypothetical protein [Aeromonas hydrophila]
MADQQQVPSHGIVSGNDGLLSLTAPRIGNDYGGHLGVPLQILIPAVRGGIQQIRSAAKTTHHKVQIFPFLLAVGTYVPADLVIDQSVMHDIAARSPNTGSVVRGSWRRKSRNQLDHASWLDVVEAALWCFWHGDDLASGEMLLGVLLGRDERVRFVYGLLAGAFYMNKSAGC